MTRTQEGEGKPKFLLIDPVEQNRVKQQWTVCVCKYRYKQVLF